MFKYLQKNKIPGIAISISRVKQMRKPKVMISIMQIISPIPILIGFLNIFFQLLNSIKVVKWSLCEILIIVFPPNLIPTWSIRIQICGKHNHKKHYYKNKF